MTPDKLLCNKLAPPQQIGLSPETFLSEVTPVLFRWALPHVNPPEFGKLLPLPNGQPKILSTGGDKKVCPKTPCLQQLLTPKTHQCTWEQEGYRLKSARAVLRQFRKKFTRKIFWPFQKI